MQVACRREMATNFIKKQDFGTSKKLKDEKWES